MSRPRPARSSSGSTHLLRWAVTLLLVANGCALLVKGADSPADPYLIDPTAGATVVAPSDDFGEIAFRVGGPGAVAGERCALLADTAELRQRGLMRVTTLGDYQGMVFQFSADTTGAFFMKDTPMPLSIAWFDSDGRLVSTADMAPCLGQSDCPLYSPSGPYRVALEVPQGELQALGVGPGTLIAIGGNCP